MSRRMFTFVRQNWGLLIVFSLSCCAALWFGFNVLFDVIYFNDPQHQDQDLKGWMTPRYIVMSYDLPRPLVLELLEISPDEPGGQRLGRVASELGLTLDELTIMVREAAAAYRETEQ